MKLDASTSPNTPAEAVLGSPSVTPRSTVSCDGSNHLPRLLPQPPSSCHSNTISAHQDIEDDFIQQLLTPEDFKTRQNGSDVSFATDVNQTFVPQQSMGGFDEISTHEAQDWNILTDPFWVVEHDSTDFTFSMEGSTPSEVNYNHTELPLSPDAELDALKFVRETHVAPRDIFPPQIEEDQFADLDGAAIAALTPQSMDTSSHLVDCDTAIDSIEDVQADAKHDSRDAYVPPKHIKDCLLRLDASRSSDKGSALLIALPAPTPDCTHSAQISALTRDQMIALSQRLFKKAMKAYGLWTPGSYFLLPSSKQMERCIKLYFERLEPQYDVFGDKVNDVNALFSGQQVHHANILVLLLVAAGTLTIPEHGAQSFSAGLSEMCQIALEDVFLKDETFLDSEIATRCYVLLRLLRAWNGSSSAVLVGRTNVVAAHRLTSHAMIEQEITLLQPMAHCAASVNTETIPLDGDDRPLSLGSLFQAFLEDGLTADDLTPAKVRLLLCPIQTLVLDHCRLAEMREKGTASVSSAEQTSTLSASALLRHEELKCLLNRWATLASQLSNSYDNVQPMIICAWLLYHTISLGLYAPRIAVDVVDAQPMHDGRPAVLHHSSEIFRIVQRTPAERRPLWWAAAVYRAALVSQSHSGAKAETKRSTAATKGGFETVNHISLVDRKRAGSKFLELLEREEHCTWHTLNMRRRLAQIQE
ncbi:Hypothetical protein D9617_14g075930 [Elsinoe fawcettii]|nr:Hypothetical protein D9617_14g075930 [Elsinoe fawcettii]